MSFKARNEEGWKTRVRQKRSKNLKASTKQELQKILKEIKIVQKYYYSNDQTVEEKNEKLKKLNDDWGAFLDKVYAETNKIIMSKITETDIPDDVGVTFSTDLFHKADIIKPSKKLFDDLSCNQFLKDIKSNEWYWVWTGNEKIEIRKTAPVLEEDKKGKIGVVNPKEKYWGRVVSSSVVGNSVGDKVNKTVGLSVSKTLGFSEKFYLNLSVAITPGKEEEAVFKKKYDTVLRNVVGRESDYKQRFGRYNDMFASIEAFYPEDNTACKLFRVKVDKWIQTLITQVKQNQNANEAHPFNENLIEKVDGQNEEYTYKLIIPGVTSFNYKFGGDKNKVEYDTDENREIFKNQPKANEKTIEQRMEDARQIMTQQKGVTQQNAGLLENVVLKF